MGDVRFCVGDIVTRDGTDLHRVIEASEIGDTIVVECTRAPYDGWCEVGELETNLARRYGPAPDSDVPEADRRLMLTTLHNRAQFVIDRWVPEYMIWEAGEVMLWRFTGRALRIRRALAYLQGVAAIEKRTEPIEFDPADCYWRVKIAT